MRYQLNLEDDTANRLKIEGGGDTPACMVRGIDRIITKLDMVKPTTKPNSPDDGEGKVEKRQRLAQEQKIANALKGAREWIRKTGERLPFNEVTEGLTEEMIAEDIAEFKSFVQSLKDAEKAKTAANIPQHNALSPFVWTDADEARWDAAIAAGTNTEEQKIASRARCVDGRTKTEPAPPAKALTYAEQLAANPWPKDTDGGDDATAWTGE